MIKEISKEVNKMRLELTQEIINRYEHDKPLLAIAPSHHCLAMLKMMIWNRYNVNVYGITFESSDTEFTYLVYSAKKLNKKQVEILRNYSTGAIDALR